MKLPAFYLLDAMSKNVYEPYARHFAPLVIGLFLETYQQVDQATRSKMEEMLLTWRTASPTGKELFGVIPQHAIERGIWGGDSNITGVSFPSASLSPSRTEDSLGTVWPDLKSTGLERT
jgi:pre-mRNA cleavage complex 2 protein Pcf11